MEFLWIESQYRLKGIGRQLLVQVEKLAKEIGCGKVFLTTFGFQARDFYLKYGYWVVGTLDDYPPAFQRKALLKVGWACWSESLLGDMGCGLRVSIERTYYAYLFKQRIELKDLRFGLYSVGRF
ncbi:GNAT family N-acetyltransferase [Desulfosporosinus sp. SB140]|uniref:GNAT family N-acetyltransferase n=1 Tax=Desulfosporosinus paludis TaxID=3115649 RepID=UPI00388F52E2